MSCSEMRNQERRLQLLVRQVNHALRGAAENLQSLGEGATCGDWAAFEALQDASISLEDALGFVAEKDREIADVRAVLLGLGQDR